MEYNKQDDLQKLSAGCGAVVWIVFLHAVMVVVAGYTIQYAWNTLIINTFDVKPLLLWQAIGVDLVVTYITGYSSGLKEEEKGKIGAVMAMGLWRSVNVFATVAVISWFI